MRSRRIRHYALVVVALCGLSAVAELPADGVQTARFGLAASGARSKILHAASDQPIHDSVLVYNRTGSSLTISLDVVGVTQKADGSYSLGASGSGLAHDVQLQTRSVTLPAKGRQTVGLTINPVGDVSSSEFAAVTAVAGRASSPGVSVTERLAVLVGVTPPAAGSSHGGRTTHARRVAVIVATVLLFALVAMLIAWLTLRRRRTTAA